MGCGCNKNKGVNKSTRIDESPKIIIPPANKSCSGVTSYNPPRRNTTEPIPRVRLKRKGLKIL